MALLPTSHHFAALAPKLQDFVVPNERCTSQWHCVLVQTFPRRLVGQRWLKVGAPGKRGKHGRQVFFLFEEMGCWLVWGYCPVYTFGYGKKVWEELANVRWKCVFFLFWEGLGMGCFMFEVRSLFSGRGDEEWRVSSMKRLKVTSLSCKKSLGGLRTKDWGPILRQMLTHFTLIQFVSESIMNYVLPWAAFVSSPLNSLQISWEFH